MTWIVRYFNFMAAKWSRLRDNVPNLHAGSEIDEGALKLQSGWHAGAIAYAARQQSTWLAFAQQAADAFSEVNSKFARDK